MLVEQVEVWLRVSMAENVGTSSPAKATRMTITTTSSINVKP